MKLESGLMMKNKKGFTLIELLAVIVILGILLSISITAVNKIRRKQNVENKLNIVSNIMTGAKSYIADHPEFWDSEVDGDFRTGSSNPSNLGNGKWLKLSDVIKYADFDTEKFPELYYANYDETDDVRSAFVRYCSNTSKYEIIYTYREAKTNSYTNYNLTDCGCEEQKNNAHSFKFCDADVSGAGWDINGKYYYKGEDDKYYEDSSKDIKFEK